MKKFELTATPRDIQGTKGAAALRREKRVPCVLYGGGETIHFSVDEAALTKSVFSADAFQFILDINGTKRMAQIQEKQFHPTSDKLLHVDFLEMSEDKEARVALNLRLTGQSTGVRKGGKLSQAMRKLRVKGLPSALPEHLELDITDLDIAQSVRVKDLKFPGVTVAEKALDVVVTIKAPKKEKEVAETPAKGKK